MYMRFVQTKIKPDRLSELRQHYEQKVVPALKKMAGCLYACLMHSKHHQDESISLTLWDTPQQAEAYEQSGVFQQLLQEARPYLSEASEWRIQLSRDLTLEYLPITAEPTVKSYAVTASADENLPAHMQIPSMYLRIVSPKIKPGKMEEFKTLYSEEIIPVLRTVQGCRYAYLTESMKEKTEIISVTLWDSIEDAENYERSGAFDKLTEKVKHTFSELYQWKMGLEKEYRGRVATSEDLTIQHYDIVAGTSFK